METSLRETRKQLGLTQEQVAERLGVTRRSIIKYEQGLAPKWYRTALEGLKAETQKA